LLLLGCRDLIGRMLVVNPKERATMEIIFTHPWVNEGQWLMRIITQPKLYCTPVIDENLLNALCERIRNYRKEDIVAAVTSCQYNDLYAAYYLLYYRQDVKMNQTPMTESPEKLRSAGICCPQSKISNNNNNEDVILHKELVEELPLKPSDSLNKLDLVENPTISLNDENNLDQEVFVLDLF